MKLPIAVLSITMAGALMAQTSAPAPSPSNDHHSAARRSGGMLQRLTRRLNLTADQQTRVKAIFADSRQQAKALAPQLRQERTALKAAMKTDSESQIDQITQQNAQLTAQVEAMHVKAMAKVYAILSSDQKAKFDRMDAHRVARFRHEREGNAPTHS